MPDTNFWATPIGWSLLTFGQILLVTLVLLLTVAFMIYGDRKIFAGVQMRKGPNVVGPFGLLQSFADLGKFLIKELSSRPAPTRRCSCWRRSSASPWRSAPGR